MLRGRFLAGAYAAATFDAVRRTRARACFEPDPDIAQFKCVRELAQRIERGALRAEHAVNVAGVAKVDVGRADEPRRAVFRGLPGVSAQIPVAAKLPARGRQQFFHQPRFFEQRAQFAGSFLPVDTLDLTREGRVFGGFDVARKMRQHARAQVGTLADVNRHVVLAVENIHTGRFRQVVQHELGESRRQRRRFELGAGGGVDCVGAEFVAPFPHEVPQHARIAQRAVARLACDCVAFHQAVEIVPRVARVELAREFHRAQDVRRILDVETAELRLEKPVVEARVVRDQHFAVDARLQLLRDFGKRRSERDHVIADPGQRFDERRNAHPRIDERAPLAHIFTVLDFDQADFGDAVEARGGTGGFEVEKNERAVEHGANFTRKPGIHNRSLTTVSQVYPTQRVTAGSLHFAFLHKK